MSTHLGGDEVEAQIGQWRSYLQSRRAIEVEDVDELEDHLRGQISTLQGAGLAGDEAFLVAVKRMGALDAVSNEFAREHSDRLWKQLVVAPGPIDGEAGADRTEMLVVFGLAFLAAAAIKIPALFGYDLNAEAEFYMRNISVVVASLLTGYFVWKRKVDATLARWLAVAFLLAALLVNSYPYGYETDTGILTIIHLPIALWLAVGIAYASGQWSDDRRRMNFVRFSGELFIYYVLIALGGGVLTAFTLGIFQAIGIDMELFATEWMIPCGAAGAVIVGSWLVEAKQSVIENMAPVLTRIFTPLFTASLLAFLATMVVTGRGIEFERDVLIAFDLVLVLVLALLLYAVSARDSDAPPNFFDWLQMTLVVTALIVDVIALTAIAGRISDFGFTPNRVAALGENLILLVNLAWSAVLYFRFLRGTDSFRRLEHWQTRYLPVFSIWAAFVVVVFPPLFGFR